MNISVLNAFLNDLKASNIFLVDQPILNTLIALKHICDINIIGNKAVTFSFEEKYIYVTTDQKQYEVVSFLWDDGCAIEESLTIMEKFNINHYPYKDREWRRAAIKAELSFSFEEEEKEEEPAYW